MNVCVDSELHYAASIGVDVNILEQVDFTFFLQLVKFEYIYMNNNCLTSEKVENIQLLIRII